MMKLLIKYTDREKRKTYEEECNVEFVIIFIEDKAVGQLNPDGSITKPVKERKLK